ncbi:uncharacterized protein LOC130649083 isoform X2 [Hydractinia symbiolongicarpus]|uniref:uncharacterized protein LOC130649083 isoform X2 n=1 Tax=Hydractinia symbiolongicarpus TaxID=13093 RepID=UPI00254E71AD|nr:uncharacterized protein LOC130649083 isoform X2 [Hydractinia symbiolongicarpus]
MQQLNVQKMLVLFSLVGFMSVVTSLKYTVRYYPYSHQEIIFHNAPPDTCSKYGLFRTFIHRSSVTNGRNTSCDCGLRGVFYNERPNERPSCHFQKEFGKGSYDIEIWNVNKSWVQYKRSRDFLVTVRKGNGGRRKNTISFQWNTSLNRDVVWPKYAGNLLRVTPYCGSKRLSSFWAIAEGSRTYEMDEDEKADDKPPKTSVYIVASISVVVMIFALFTFIHWSRKRCFKSDEKIQSEPITTKCRKWVTSCSFTFSFPKEGMLPCCVLSLPQAQR